MTRLFKTLLLVVIMSIMFGTITYFLFGSTMYSWIITLPVSFWLGWRAADD